MKSAIASLLLACCLLAAGEAQPVTIATVDLEAVSNAVGYENILVLNADEDSRKALAAVRAEMQELKKAIIAAEDVDNNEGGLLQKHQRLEQKYQMITQLLRRGNGNGDSSRALAEFVKAEFGTQYPIILNSNFNRSNRNNGFINLNASYVDITDAVINLIRTRY